MRLPRRSLMLGAGMIFLLWLMWKVVLPLGSLITSPWFSEQTVDRTNDWSRYYGETVSGYFTLPREIVVVSAVHTNTAIMGERWIVKFRLPNTRLPEKWLAKIAHDSKMKPGYHVGRYKYDCGQDCDFKRIEYVPATRLYVAEGGWD